MAVFFLDANVVFSACLSDKGHARALFHLAQARYCTLLTSSYAAEEARRNLSVKYRKHLPTLHDLEPLFTIIPEASPALVTWANSHVVAKDAPILAAAVASGADYLVTGDQRHFGHLYGQVLEDLTVVSLKGALELLL
ncbi:MAG: putative toxin-antitoxin system toxin component, PIN family [Deinococcota bacterium]